MDGNVIQIMEACDFPHELKITMEASNKMVTEFLLHTPFQECTKLMSFFSYTS